MKFILGLVLFVSASQATFASEKPEMPIGSYIYYNSVKRGDQSEVKVKFLEIIQKLKGRTEDSINMSLQLRENAKIMNNAKYEELYNQHYDAKVTEMNNLESLAERVKKGTQTVDDVIYLSRFSRGLTIDKGFGNNGN